jgi:hypothetical protein
MERTEVFPLRARSIGRPGTLPRALVVLRHDRVDICVQGLDAGDTGIDELQGADFAASEQRQTLRRRPIAQLVHRVLTVGGQTTSTV